MKREEAINLLYGMRSDNLNFDDAYTKDKYDALDMAIEALEQESCEDEYIKVPKKALKYRTAEMVAYNVEWLKKHFDMERAVIFRELAESEVEEMSEQMKFPESFEKFAKEYGFKDDKEIYTNGSDLIPIFRVKQWLEHDNKLRTILDTIIAEIEALNPVDYVSMSSYEGHRGAEDMKDDVLQIIDKYMTESEIKG